jgi:LacI family transcriptional regulator
LFFARITAHAFLPSLFKDFLRIALSLGPYLLSGLLDAEKTEAYARDKPGGQFLEYRGAVGDVFRSRVGRIAGPARQFRAAAKLPEPQRCGILFSMTVTLSDIAKELNVSVVTVSKALRNKGKISVQTRRRVLKRAKELNYQPNWIARSLVTQRSYTLGLLLPDFTHPFFAEIAKTIAETVRPRGYHIIITYFEEDPALERSEADALLARRVDGLIIASAQSSERPEMFEQFRIRKIPFVLIDRHIAGVRASFVGADNKAIGRMGTTHLIEQGCRRIAHLRGPNLGLANERLAGYREAMEKHGLQVPPNYIVEAGFQDNTGYQAMRKLLRATQVPDGVFCYNDPLAIGAMKAIIGAGLRIPQDIRVVGTGNVHYSDVLAVPLTTIDQETRQIGARAAELLLAQIESKRFPRPTKILIAPRLVQRESTQGTR